MQTLKTHTIPDLDFRDAVLAGLNSRPRAIPCRFFYDARGSRLFDRICELPEYYPTRTEMALLADHADEMAALIGPDADLVEFGAGSSTKVRLLLDALDRPHAFVPIDISGDHLKHAAQALEDDYPGLAVTPVVGDFTRPLTLPPVADGVRRVGFFPGSTIGNFAPSEARAFLRRAARMLAGGGLLIGVDLVKDPAVLEAAYDDAAGVTAAFNKNLLVRANAELGADFNIDGFAHKALFNDRASRIEMHLESLGRQQVRIGRDCFSFAPGETIHTENSYKYTVDGFRQAAETAGFRLRRTWADGAGLFSVHWLEAQPVQ